MFPQHSSSSPQWTHVSTGQSHPHYGFSHLLIPSTNVNHLPITSYCALYVLRERWKVKFQTSCISDVQGIGDREGNGTPLRYSCLENPMDGGAWQAAVHRVVKSRTQLSDFTFTLHSHALEKEMATHSSVLAWRIPGTGEPGGLLSIGSHRVGHD